MLVHVCSSLSTFAVETHWKKRGGREGGREREGERERGGGGGGEEESSRV